MSTPGKKSHPIRTAFFWLCILVFLFSITYLSMSASKAPRPEVKLHRPGQYAAPPPSNDSSSLATVTAIISAAGALSTMALSWAQFFRDRKKT